VAKSDGASMPSGPERSLLLLLRESGDALGAACPSFDVTAGAARLAEAAQAHGLLQSGGRPEDDLAVTDAGLEEQAPPFDVEAGAARLRQAARDLVLLPEGTPGDPSSARVPAGGHLEIEFKILGPPELLAPGRGDVTVAPQLWCVLVSLLLAPNMSVPTEILVERLWGDEAPPNPRATIRSYIWRIDRVLSRVAGDTVHVSRQVGGYALNVDPHAVDLHKFRSLRRQSDALAESGELQHAAALLVEAEGLWRGQALADLPGYWIGRVRDSLEEELRSATTRRIELELMRRRHTELFHFRTGNQRLRQARLRLEDTAMGYPADRVSNHDDLQKFLDRGGEVRLVNELGSGKLVGIAFRRPGAWDWTELRLEGPAERLFRGTVTSLITQQLAQVVPGIPAPSSLDEALDKATAILSPQAIAGKLANAAAQVVAHHLGLGSIAPVAGKVAEQIVACQPVPPAAPDLALGAARVGVITYDLRAGHLTATVAGFIAGKIDDRINDLTPGVTRPQVRDVQTVLHHRPDAGSAEQPQPAVRTPEPPPPTPHPGHSPRPGRL
jgi:hypothetical protein